MKKNRLLFLITIIMWFLVVACSNRTDVIDQRASNDEKSSNTTTQPSSEEITTAEPSYSKKTSSNNENSSDVGEIDASNPVEVAQPAKQFIIRSADIKMMVPDVMKATSDIEKILSKYNGLISDSKLETLSNSFSNKLTLRVPVINFDKTINEITPLAEYIDYRNVVSEDVTKNYVDTEVRLKNKREVEKRFIEVLRNQAKTVRDILEVERQLNEIRTEIESAESYLNSLKDKVSLSTITVEVYQTVNYQKPPNTYNKSVFTDMREALSSGWYGILSLFIFALHLWPLIFIIATALSVVYFLKWRKRK